MSKTSQLGPHGKKGNLEIAVLHSRCIGAAVCIAQAAGSFILDKNNKALVADLSKNSEEVLLASAQNCPTQAILVYKNKKQIWPLPGDKGRDLQPRSGSKLKMKFD